MLKEELVSAIARRNPHLARGDVETVLTSVIETINEALPKRDQIKLTESGSVSIVEKQLEKATRSRLNDKKNVPSAIADTLDQINKTIESIL